MYCDPKLLTLVNSKDIELLLSPLSFATGIERTHSLKLRTNIVFDSRANVSTSRYRVIEIRKERTCQKYQRMQSLVTDLVTNDQYFARKLNGTHSSSKRNCLHTYKMCLFVSGGV